jgi:two-component system CheB/CheR fusion protein
VNRSLVREAALPDAPVALAEFESLLTYLKQSRGFDFSAYKRSSLMRRVLVRMQAIGAEGFAGYLDTLQVDPEEFTRLFNTILINVTSFFRDAAAWEYLRNEMIARLVGPPGARDCLRVWSAGCASGEEAYSIAILLAEAVGFDAFRERVTIYATDVDEEALGQARLAVYGGRVAEDVPARLVAKYFERQDDRYVFNKELRRSVILGRHNLIQDAPISRVDLLICRNCLMYFNAETQGRILRRLHFALSPGGILFLGKAETPLVQGAVFEAVDIKRRIFVKAEHHSELRPLTLAQPRPVAQDGRGP